MKAFLAKFQKPRNLGRLLFASEILIFIAVCLTILAVLKLHPVPLTLFIIIVQPFFIIGIVIYIIVTTAWFFSHRGTSHINYAPGEIIFKEGDEADFVYSIVHGNVEIIREDVGEGEKVIAVLGPGDYFGEMAIASNRPRNATAKAVNSVKTMTIAKGDFVNLHESLPALKENIDKLIQRRAAELKAKDT